LSTDESALTLGEPPSNDPESFIDVFLTHVDAGRRVEEKLERKSHAAKRVVQP
jgi:hypothetical protein